MSSENFFWRKTSVALFLSFENCRKHHVGIQLHVSNYKKFKLESCNWTPTWSRADYVANRCAEDQSQIFL